MLNKTLFEFLETNPPVFWVSDFRVIIATTPDAQNFLDCVLQTQTQADQAPKGTRVRLSIEAAETLVRELQSQILVAKAPPPPTKSQH